MKNENELENKLREKGGRGSSISIFVTGLGLGAALGVLFAPRSGEDTRDYISSSAKAGLNGAVAVSENLTRRAKQTVNRAKDRVSHARDVGEQAYQEAKNTSPE